MTGCRGCLGLLVFLALLAWLIEQLRPVLGWSNAQAGGFLLAGVALLAIGSSRRGRAGPRPARLMTVTGGEAPEARAALARGSDAIKLTEGWWRVPLAAGGATAEDNLLTACDECNLGKATRMVVPIDS